MMDCKIVQDLLPLYTDGCCSEETRRAVEEHLKICADCRDIFHAMNGQLPVEKTEPEEIDASQTMKKGMKKIRSRWLASLLAIIVLIPVVWISWNQIRGVGMHLTNLNEYRICSSFLGELVQDDYEGAYRYFDIDAIRRDWQEWEFDDEKLANLEADGLAQFLEDTAALKAEGLTDYKYMNAYEGDDWYVFYFSVMVRDEAEMIRITVNDRGIQSLHGGNGYLPDPDALTQMSLWREHLWQEYSGCYYDWTTASYVYPDAG